jgi:putative ABC transport system permease protein
VLLKPLPYREPEQLVLLWETSEQVEKTSVSLLNFRDWEAQSRSFAALGVYRPMSFNLSGLETSEKVRALQVSSGVLRALGVAPAAGRLFDPEDDRPGTAKLLLGHRFWHSRFGADSGIVGRTVLLDGAPYSVVGLLTASFQFPTPDLDVLVPIGCCGPDEMLANRGQRKGLLAVARLRAGVPLAAAQGEMATIAARLAS